MAPSRSFRQLLQPAAWPLVASAWLGSIQAARAQAVDQYLDTGIPGYNTAAGVTVATRQRPDYDAQGVRLGNYVITPVLTESVGYDDNVTGTPHAHGSALIETNATLNATGGWSDTRFAGALTVDDLQYPQQSNQGYTNWSAALGASHDFGRDTLSIGASHLNLNQTPRDLDVPGLTQTVAFRVDGVRANYHVDLGRIFVQPGIDVSYYSYDNGVVGGQQYLQSYRDRITFAPEIVGSYEFATRRRLVLIVRDIQADFDRSPPGQPRQNFNDASVLGGVAYDADGVVSFRLLAGYEERSFSASSTYSMVQAPIVEGAATWTPSGLTTITGTAARYIEDSASEATVGFTETALKLQLDHEYLRNVILSVHGAYFIDDYNSTPTSSGSSQTYFTGGFGGSYALNRNVRLAADYTFSTRNGGGGTNTVNPSVPVAFGAGGAIFGGNYSENTFRLTLRLAL